MNAERLLQHYEQIADAPDAVARLRRFILDLAVRGKLVPQDPADEPASELLTRIWAEKKRLLAQANIKQKQSIPQDSQIAIFDVPVGWSWCQLDEVSWKITDGEHLTPKREVNGRFLLSARNVLNGRIDISDVDFVGDAEFERMRRRCDPNKNDLLISCSGSVGRVAIVDADETYVLVRSAALVKPVHADEIAPFLSKALISSFLQNQMGIRSKSAAQPNLFIGSIRQLLIPLPPLAEQRRIVAKVDELMALCDKLEAARTERETKRDRLAAASLARLNTPDPETFRDDARFALDALPALTARPDQMKQLRQTIPNLAVRGKLVPQDPADEPAAELLKTIAVEKGRSEKRKAKELHTLERAPPLEITFQLPGSWEWVPATYPALVISEGDRKVRTKDVLEVGFE